MADKRKTKRSKELKNKFRFVVLNDTTFEEKFSLSLTRTNVWIFMSVVVFTLVFLTAAAIIYTPLKYFIPGFGDYNYRSRIIQLQFQADSLQNYLDARQLWLENLLAVATETVDSAKPAKPIAGNTDKLPLKLSEATKEEMELRKEVEDEENFSLSSSHQNSGWAEDVKRMHLIAPVNGYITESYNSEKEHVGIDIAAKEGAAILAVFDGKIVTDNYTLETGYVLIIQHDNNLVSVYKHNSHLLKKAGDTVKAGDVIALAGNTGELSTGPHLHFELWYKGKSLNPKEYIAF